MVVTCYIFLVQSLKREKALRVFKLNTGQDDHAIMLIDDYLSQVGGEFIFCLLILLFCCILNLIPLS